MESVFHARVISSSVSEKGYTLRLSKLDGSHIDVVAGSIHVRGRGIKFDRIAKCTVAANNYGESILTDLDYRIDENVRVRFDLARRIVDEQRVARQQIRTIRERCAAMDRALETVYANHHLTVREIVKIESLF